MTDPRPTAVLLLDLDNFKGINDRFGHAMGDRVLQMFAEIGSGCMHRFDIFGRLGGEEFAAVLVNTTRERALAVAEEIRAAFADATREIESKPVGRDRQYRLGHQLRCSARFVGTSGPCRSCALSRQGQRP